MNKDNGLPYRNWLRLHTSHAEILHKNIYVQINKYCVPVCVKECNKAQFHRHGALMVTMSDGFKQLTQTFYHRPAQSLNMYVQNKPGSHILPLQYKNLAHLISI
jgi:hypothetical protein